MAVTRARPELGVVYTPHDVCEPMVRLALAPALARGHDLRQLRIYDPAIGEGAFLVEIVRVLGDALGGTREARRLVAERCIYGIDIDALGGTRAARRLVAARCIYGNDIAARAVEAAPTAVEQLVGAPVPALREHLRVGDALSAEWPHRFDVVLGNPPYVRQERLGNKQALRGYAAYDGVADLYVYFIELALRVADRFCLIVPNKWMTAAYGRPLRELLAAQRCVEGVVDFASGLPLFGDADAFPCIVWGGTGATNEHALDEIRAMRASPKATVADALASAGTAHPRARWTSGPWHIDTRDDAALLERLRTRGPALGELIGSRWSRGVVTGLNRAFVIDAETRARLLDEEPAAAGLIRPFVKGRDIRRWQPADSERFILLVDRGTSLAALPRVRAHLSRFREALAPKPEGHRGAWPGRKPGAYRWYELQDPVVPLAKSRAPRLFYQDIQTAPACCLDASGERVPDTTVWILPSADLYLLALLNSPLYFWYARRRFPPALNGAVRPKLEYMRALPIAAPAPALRARIEALVTAQLGGASSPRDAELAELVNTVYGLTPAERALVASASGS